LAERRFLRRKSPLNRAATPPARAHDQIILALTERRSEELTKI
jgi:hypothetical protein